jgi:hypothetical protein
VVVVTPFYVMEACEFVELESEDDAYPEPAEFAFPYKN